MRCGMLRARVDQFRSARMPAGRAIVSDGTPSQPDHTPAAFAAREPPYSPLNPSAASARVRHSAHAAHSAVIADGERSEPSRDPYTPVARMGLGVFASAPGGNGPGPRRFRGSPGMTAKFAPTPSAPRDLRASRAIQPEIPTPLIPQRPARGSPGA